MMIERISKAIAVIVLLGVFIIISCKKDEPVNAKINIYLTDAPAAYDAVNIDIQSVMILCKGAKKEKPLKTIHSGIYDLLKLTNGIDSLVGSIELSPGKIIQIRLVLGENNSLVNSGESIILDVPSGAESGLIMNIDQEMAEGETYNIWIDFDASRSIIDQGNGIYYLVPVLRAFTSDIGGAIRGIITPKDAKPFIHAISSSDTLSTIPNNDGRFLIRGVPAGTYNIKFIPQKSGLREGEIENVVVEADKTTYIGTIALN